MRGSELFTDTHLTHHSYLLKQAHARPWDILSVSHWGSLSDLEILQSQSSEKSPDLEKMEMYVCLFL